MPQRNRCKKVGDFGFDPAHPTPSPAVFNMIGGQRCKKSDGFGFDPAHPTPSPQAKPLERSHTDGSKDWEAPSFEEAKLHASHRGIRIHAPPGGKSTLTLN